MPTKIFAALVALLLVLAYVAPMVIKMKDMSLAIVIGIGIIVMLVDLWQSLRETAD